MRLVLIIVFAITALSMQAQIKLEPIQVANHESSFELVFITAPWCKWCHRMKDKTFQDARFSAFSARWSFYELNSESQDPILFHGREYFPDNNDLHTLVSSLIGSQKLVLPYVIVLNSAQEIVFEQSGFMDAEALENALTSIEAGASSTK